MIRSSMPGIFLSYRREDSAPYARLLQMALRDRLPDVSVFLDRVHLFKKYLISGCFGHAARLSRSIVSSS